MNFIPANVNIFSKSFWQFGRDRFFTRAGRFQSYGTDKPTIEIDCNDSMFAYSHCPHLRAVIDKKAEMFSSGEWKCIDVNDESIEFPDDEGLKLLNAPNILQSREDFLFQASFYKSLFSNNFIYKIQGSTLVLPKVLWHLPSDEMSIRFLKNTTFFDQYELEGIIDKFIFNYGGSYKYYDVKDIIFKAENFSFMQGKGMSKIPSLSLPVNNLVASLKTRNILSVNFGVKGYISPEGKDALGSALPLRTEAREQIEKELGHQYNLFSPTSKIKIVDVPTKFNIISIPQRDMMLLENEAADAANICAMFGMAKDIFPWFPGSTYENQIRAQKNTIETTIMQDADSFAGIMTSALQPAVGRKYILSYDWLPIMKEDGLKEAQEDKVETERLSLLLHDGVISHETYAQLAGVEMTGTKTIQPKAPTQAQQQTPPTN